MASNRRHFVVAALGLICLLTGCDAVNRHKVLSTILDGVPALPPPEQICADYMKEKTAKLPERAPVSADSGAVADATADPAENDSVHRPYGENKCDTCHDKKGKKDDLILPSNQLCFSCHKDFFKGVFRHGPAAVGDCGSCHLPHNSPNVQLLKTSRKAICATCHKENRAALSFHNKVAERKLICVDCHNPHYGNSPFFLR